VRIALFDYLCEPTNPLGGCHLTMMRRLCHEHEFTVFAVRFDNPCPERIRFVRIPVPSRPLALLFICYHIVAPLVYLLHRLRTGRKYDLVQCVESNYLFADVSYTQFCHRAFLRHHWKKIRTGSMRSLFRWVDHWLHALLEPLVFRRIRRMVVASHGVKRDLVSEYPFLEPKISVIFNAIDIQRMQAPADFDRAAKRRELGYSDDDVVMIFMALGHFERKGLPYLLDGMVRYNQPRLKLMVVGGTADLIEVYEKRVQGMNLQDRVRFLGMQKDVRPFLWAADAFALPSLYEAFALVVLEAAAAGLPLIVTPINGVEEFVVDGENGYLVQPDGADIARCLQAFMDQPPSQRTRVGDNARTAISRFSVDAFIDNWRSFYAEQGSV